MSEPGAGGRRQRLLQVASAAGFLAVLAVVVLIVVAGSTTSGGDTKIEGGREVRALLAGIPQEGLTLGQPSANATLVEFGDLKCPICAEYSKGIVPELIAGEVRTGRARIEFRSFTIIDAQSEAAGAAAIAAGTQGRGWNFVELFYRNQGSESAPYADDEFLAAVARSAGVRDLARWNRERRSPAVLAEVRRTTAQAGGLGFTGTPSFAVQGPGGGLTPIGTPGSASEIAAKLEEAG